MTEPLPPTFRNWPRQIRSGFGICLATVDGRMIRVGDWEHEFTIQSICKPFAFQMALEEFGRDEVLTHVGVEPSGDAFNSIELDPKTMRPFNPHDQCGRDRYFVADQEESSGRRSAGVRGKNAGWPPAGRCELTRTFSRRRAATGNRNRAIAYLMLNFGIIDGEVDHIASSIFFAMLAAGELPGSGHDGGDHRKHGHKSGDRRNESFDFQYIKDVMTVMFTCGLYDHAGEWAYRVGLPAKSGVSGGILGYRQPAAGYCGILAETGRQRQQRARNSRCARIWPTNWDCTRLNLRT